MNTEPRSSPCLFTMTKTVLGILGTICLIINHSSRFILVCAVIIVGFGLIELMGNANSTLFQTLPFGLVGIIAWFFIRSAIEISVLSCISGFICVGYTAFTLYAIITMPRTKE